MSEINNLNLGKSRVSATKKVSSSASSSSFADAEKIIDDLSVAPSASIGRSQISGVDNIDNDTRFMLNHPDEVDCANDFFDKAYKVMSECDVEHPYEKSAMQMGTFKEEFLSK